MTNGDVVYVTSTTTVPPKQTATAQAEGGSQAPAPAPAPAAAPAPAEQSQAEEPPAPSNDPYTITGTVYQISGIEYVNSKGYSDMVNPSDDPDEMFWMLDIDPGTSLSGNTLGGTNPGVKEQSGESFYFAEGVDPSPYEGKQVSVTYDPSQSHWPSDASMPLGALRATVTNISG